jgi:hypothetical protein
MHKRVKPIKEIIDEKINNMSMIEYKEARRVVKDSSLIIIEERND